MYSYKLHNSQYSAQSPYAFTRDFFSLIIFDTSTSHHPTETASQDQQRISNSLLSRELVPTAPTTRNSRYDIKANKPQQPHSFSTHHLSVSEMLCTNAITRIFHKLKLRPPLLAALVKLSPEDPDGPPHTEMHFHHQSSKQAPCDSFGTHTL